MSARRKAYHHGDLRRALVEGALTLVAEHGPEALSLKELARRLGVSHAAMYRHFDSKIGLFDAIAAAGFAELRDTIARALAAAPKNPRDRFLAGAWGYVAFAIDHPAPFRVMFFGPKREPRDPDGLAARAGAFQLLLDFIADAQKTGVIGPGKPLAIAMPIWAMHHGIASLACSAQLDVGGRATMKRLCDEAHLALLDGLARGVKAPARLPRPPKSRGM
jgi:AcrR family transcriptional regulator